MQLRGILGNKEDKCSLLCNLPASHFIFGWVKKPGKCQVKCLRLYRCSKAWYSITSSTCPPFENCLHDSDVFVNDSILHAYVRLNSILDSTHKNSRYFGRTFKTSNEMRGSILSQQGHQKINCLKLFLILSFHNSNIDICHFSLQIIVQLIIIFSLRVLYVYLIIKYI